MTQPLALIRRRKAEIEKEIQECRDRISALQAELPELEVAARVLTRLENQEFDQALAEIEDEVSSPPVPPHAKPANIPTMPDMVLESLATPEAMLNGGLEPADIRDFIAKRWWSAVRPDVVGPIAWRMWKRGQLKKNGTKYLLPKNYLFPKSNEPVGTPSESAPTGSNPESVSADSFPGFSDKAPNPGQNGGGT
ncbi:MAG: hypothetical protein AB7V61_11210 [Methylocystis sp.]